MDISNPTDAALIAMKLFIAKAMPTKLTHTPTMPILIPFIQSHAFVKLELVYLFFLHFTMSLIKKAIVPHTATIEAMYAISLCIEKL